MSTDSAEIAAVAHQTGAEVIDRPTELAGDEASSESAVAHALAVLRSREQTPEIVALVQCTSPFLTGSDIDGVVRLVEAREADCAFTAAPAHFFLWQRVGGKVEPVNHASTSRPRRQDLEPQYVETGGAYAMRVDGFLAAGHRFFGRIACFEVSPLRAVEIDSEADLVLANVVAPALRGRPLSDVLPDRIGGLALDFDGVLTDNRVVTLDSGAEAVVSNRSDGLGIGMLREVGLPMVVISKERNPVVAARCDKLGLDCWQGVDDKASALRTWAEQHRLPPSDLIFVGNDVNDVPCLQLVGCGVAVADAHPAAIAAANAVLSRPGGDGAVREVADVILASLRGREA